ncbi:hypothetical protein K435DRAFT_784510 [Dendrothele bispora CBS 962.96]|uniref:Uncharacterized protein n=1 Tax=Dendrothele bispora (strain CBS 962.96) TaxID=1314807 RepID=A0A4S8L2Q0_DENBC|nr:hypothetical protein K435DRAFT_784510 [Dendrothele bispora CBS 962.96]
MKLTEPQEYPLFFDVKRKTFHLSKETALTQTTAELPVHVLFIDSSRPFKKSADDAYQSVTPTVSYNPERLLLDPFPLSVLFWITGQTSRDHLSMRS